MSVPGATCRDGGGMCSVRARIVVCRSVTPGVVIWKFGKKRERIFDVRLCGRLPVTAFGRHEDGGGIRLCGRKVPMWREISMRRSV